MVLILALPHSSAVLEAAGPKIMKSGPSSLRTLSRLREKKRYREKSGTIFFPVILQCAKKHQFIAIYLRLLEA